MGKCPECESWNSLVEEKVQSSRLKVKSSRRTETASLLKLNEIQGQIEKRTSTDFEEFDRVLGGGIVKGSVTLLAGDPGVGKSTLLLQVALGLQPQSVLYISGEESSGQIKLRAQRIQSNAKDKNKNDFYISQEVLIEQVVEEIEKFKPALVIVDSIQTMESERLTGVAGSVGQVRECASQLVRLAKEEGIPMFLVGHVTKEGTVAGPMVLSHIVDCVLFLEGERFKTLRILRSLKNRFGPVDEVGVFTIGQNGITEEKNPSELFLNATGSKVPGSVVVSTIEGTRPILVELQALAVPTKLAFPRRVVSGVPQSRVELLCAVLQKQTGLPIDRFDIFVNVAGGLKLSEPGIDLGICLSIVSSLKNIALPKTVAIGEVGLLGEIRETSDLDKREREGKKLGFTQIISFKNYRTIGEVIRKMGKTASSN